MADILPVDSPSPAIAELTPAPGIARLDVPADEVQAAAHLSQLLAHPPLGHVKTPQPRDWYEAVFDDIATTYRLRRNAGGQS